MPPPPPHPTQPPRSKKPPHERAQAKKALRAERQQEDRAKYEVTQLQAERRAIVDALKTVTADHERLLASLGRIETENGQWQTPNASLGEMYRLRVEIEQVEKQMRECHQRWDELGEQIEEKHVEIAFGGSGDD